MFTRKPLRGRRIAVLAADGFEKVELSAPVAALRAAGADVSIVSLKPGKIRGLNVHEPAGRVPVDSTLAEADPAAFDGLFIPGGFIGPDLLRQSHEARRFVRSFDIAKKPIAVICHGPQLLASAGLVHGRTLTSWPGIRDDLVHAGGTWIDDAVVRDANWLSSRGPQDLLPFIEALTDHFCQRDHALTGGDRAVISAPQASEPPQAVIKALAWMPKTSTRIGLGLMAFLAGTAVVGRLRPALGDGSRRSRRLSPAAGDRRVLIADVTHGRRADERQVGFELGGGHMP